MHEKRNWGPVNLKGQEPLADISNTARGVVKNTPSNLGTTGHEDEEISSRSTQDPVTRLEERTL